MEVTATVVNSVNSAGLGSSRTGLRTKSLSHGRAAGSRTGSFVDSDYGSSLGSTTMSTCSKRSSFAESLASLVKSLHVTDSEQLEQLDRENAHFSLSESIIETFEEMRWEFGSKPKNPSDDKRTGHSGHCERTAQVSPTPNSHERTKQWIRIKRPRPVSAGGDYLSSPSPSVSSLSHLNEDLDSTNYDLNVDAEESDVFFEGNTMADELDHLETSGCLSSIKESGISLSNTSLFSAGGETLDESFDRRSVASFQSTIDSNDPDNSSAEWIAYNFIRKISQRNFTPPELNWIVTDLDDVPQNLLPLPKTIGDTILEDTEKKIRLRGTLEWAPPRKQVIFNIQPKVQRKVQIARQNFRCTGCGLKVIKSHESRMQYCFYTGKYFCQLCHSGKRSQLPAMVIHKWDFSRFPVSNFALNLLEKIRSEQLFNIADINCNLYKRSKTMARMSELRTQLASLREYVQSCKRGGNVLLGFLIFTPKHFVNSPDVHLYSLDDLLMIKNDPKLIERLNELVKVAIRHVSSCPSCTAKGFYCEVCITKCSSQSSAGRKTQQAINNSKDVIFPFELGRVHMCRSCKACYHVKCFTTCLKCDRIKRRRSEVNLLNCATSLNSPAAANSRNFRSPAGQVQHA